MKKNSPYASPGLKPDKDALAAQRKEQYGFANLAKEQQFRSTNKGEAKELQDKIRELTDMLEDRKNANRMLVTENQRLKKMTTDLQFQLLNKPTARGESAALKSMREMARQYKSQEEMTAAAAEQLVTELMAKNQEAVDEMQRLGEELDALQGKLATTEQALADATEEIASYQREQAQLMDEKEELVRQAEQREEENRQEIAARDAEIQSLRDKVASLEAAMEEARLAAEDALRKQKAALEAEAYLQRQQATADLQAQVASLQKLLDRAHDSLRSLNQTETLGPGWLLQELGLPPPPPPPPPPTAVPELVAADASPGSRRAGSAAASGAASPVLRGEASAASVRSFAAAGAAATLAVPEPSPSAPPGSQRPSRRPSRTGSVAGSAAGSALGSLAGPGSAAGPMAARSEAASGNLLGGSPANSVRLERSGDLPPPHPTDSADPSQGPNRDPDAVALTAAGSVTRSRTGSRPGSRALSVAASLAHSVRQSDAGEGHPGDAPAGDPAAAAEGGSGPSRAASVAGSVRKLASRPGGSQAAASVAGSRTGLGASRAGSVAGESTAGEVRGGGPGAEEQAGAKAGGLRGGKESGGHAAGAKEGTAPPAPAPPLGPRGNILELLLHDASLHPGVIGLPATDFWALLRLSCPDIGLVPLALSVPGAGASSAAAPAAGSSALPLLHAYRLHFPDDQALLTAVAAGAARVSVHNLKSAVVGAFSCPRVIPAGVASGSSGVSGGGGSGTGGGAGGGGSGMVADGTVERVVVVALRDAHNCPALELFTIDEEGRPVAPFQTLSAPWRLQLPDANPQPQPHEFCIDTHSLHRLQADAARTSGLFDTAGRVFTGRTDGHTYLVWRLADVDARRKATFKALNRMVIEPVEDPWAASAPLAAASLPLTAALSAPTITRLELSNVRLLLGGHPVVRLYEPSDDIATRTLACRTVAAGEKLLASVRVTARLARDPEVSEQLLAALQPALQAGAGAPTLPPLHWLSLLGAEELVLSRLLDELRAAVGAAAGRIMALPVHPHPHPHPHPHALPADHDHQAAQDEAAAAGGGGGGLREDDAAAAQELEQLGRQTVDAVLLKERQLSEGLASCQAVVVAASTGHVQEAPLARARMEQIRTHVARSLAQLLAFYRQRLELYRLGASAWHFIADGSPVAALPATTTPPQAACLREILRALATALQALAPPGLTAAELLTVAAAAPGAAGAAPPLMLLLPPVLAAPAEGAADSGGGGGEPAPAGAGALAAATRGLEAALRAAVDAASVAAGEACEALRREVAAPGTDDFAASEAAQRRLAAIAAPVTAALVTELAAVCQSAVAASLSEPDTVGLLRHQLLLAAREASAVSAASSSLVAAGAGAAGRGAAGDAATGADVAAALAMQLGWQATAASSSLGVVAAVGAPGAAAADAGPRAAPLLNSALQSLQWLVGAMTRAAPAPVAASPQSAGPWLRASVRLRTQLGVLCTSWSVAAVAAAGQALLLCGQRHAAVKLALEVMGREVDRVIDGTKATLEAIRANRSYDGAVLEESMPSVATTLSAHAAAAVSACFWTATQMLMTPLLVTVHSPHEYMQATAAAAAAATAAASREGRGEAAASAAAGGGGASGAGSCYSPSLHVASRVSFTVVTFGALAGEPMPAAGLNHRASDGAPPAPPPAAEHSLPASPSAMAAAAAATAAAEAPAARPMEPALSPLSHPLLTSWVPRRSILYLDVARLNAAAAAAAAAPSAAPADPSLPVDTAGLPHLGKAAEMLGWEVRHAEEYYSAYFAAAPAPAAAATTAPASMRGSAAGPGSVVPPHGSAGPGSVAGSVFSGRTGAAAASLAADPVAALSEVKMAAEMARGSDIAIVAGGRMAEAGSMVKWLTQHGVLVLEAGELRLPGGAAAITGADGDETAARELARTLVGLLAIHKLQAATVRALAPMMPPPLTAALPSAPPSAAATPRAPRSRALTPRASLSGDAPVPAPAASAAGTPLPPASVTSAAPLPGPATASTLPAAGAGAGPSPLSPQPQPVAVLTYMPDISIAKPALAACAELTHRVKLALQALQAAFAAAPAVAPHSDMLTRFVGAQLDQQALMLEGLLIAPELLRARHPGTLPRPGAAAAAAAVVRLWQAPPSSPVAPDGGDMARGPSRQGSMGRARGPPLPAITPRGTPRHTSRAGSVAGTPLSGPLGTPPRPLAFEASGPTPLLMGRSSGAVPVDTAAAADGKSTDSEDEEAGVLPLLPAGLDVASLPDDSLEKSSVASIATASTLGSMAGLRGGAGAGPSWRG